LGQMFTHLGAAVENSYGSHDIANHGRS